MIKLILSILILAVSLHADRVDEFYQNLTIKQFQKLAEIKQLGKESGLSYSLMSIAVEESQLCKVKLNINSGAVGCYHNLVSSVMPRTGKKDTPYMRNVIAVKLYENLKYATKHASLELKEWKHKRSTWREVWASYYGGKYYKGAKSVSYSDRIARGVKYIKMIEARCGSIESIEKSYCIEKGKIAWATVKQYQLVTYLDTRDQNSRVLYLD